jgi:hypothetical protein
MTVVPLIRGEDAVKMRRTKHHGYLMEATKQELEKRRRPAVKLVV